MTTPTSKAAQVATPTAGFSKYATHNSATAETVLTFEQLIALAKEPLNESIKNTLPLIAPFTTKTGRKTGEAVQAASYSAIVLDFDGVADSMAQTVAKLTAQYKGEFLAFTTFSNNELRDDFCYKIVIPLAEPCELESHQQAAKALAATFGSDKAQATATQGFYAPCDTGENDYNFTHVKGNGSRLDLSSDFLQNAIKAAPLQALNRATDNDLLALVNAENKASYAPLTAEQRKEKVTSALTKISPDVDRVTWLKVAKGLYIEIDDQTEAFEIFKEWSSKGQTYDAKRISYDWTQAQGLNDTTEATLYYLAEAGGWVNPFLSYEVAPLKMGELDRPSYPHINDKGRILNTDENLAVLLDFLGIKVNYDVIKKDMRIVIPNHTTITDTAQNANIAKIKSYANLYGMATSNIEEYLTLIAAANPVNTALQFIQAKEWDGVDRISDLVATVEPQKTVLMQNGESLHAHIIKQWLKQAVAAIATAQGFSALGVLVFQGEQGLGKTQWFKNLLPESVRYDLAKPDCALDVDSKDSVLQAVSHWLVELGELDGTFKKSDVASLKRFITETTDIIRPPYARTADRYQRRTVFFASVNGSDFLQDETGNRRYWTIATKSIDWQHNIDMQQLWAQVLAEFKQDGNYALCSEAVQLMAEINEQHRNLSNIEILLNERIDWTEQPTERLTGADIYEQLTGFKVITAKRSDFTTIKKYLEAKGIKQRKVRGNRFYVLPKITTPSQADTACNW
mgnify:CR=1 FL=1